MFDLQILMPYLQIILGRKIGTGNGVEMIQADHDVDGENYSVMILEMKQVPEYLALEESGR